MAIIKMAALVAEARGKLGGSIYSRNASGAYVKTKISPTNPQTSYQMSQRSSFGSISQAWRGLSESNRQAWAGFASQVPGTNAFGDQVFLSGFQAFVKSARNLAQLGLSYLVSPGVITAFPQIVIATISFNSNVFSLQYDLIGGETGFSVVLESTPGLQPGKSFIKNTLRQIFQETARGGEPIILTTDWTDRFGTMPAVGLKVGVAIRLIHVATGWDSARTQTTTIVKTL